mmetsp:Transcript_28331/g.45150  ORF Transcript_28331/g.45150 Transcript_28331/m.45150 type:complete len:227 (-) Transcript_28331:223-903(-)
MRLSVCSPKPNQTAKLRGRKPGFPRRLLRSPRSPSSSPLKQRTRPRKLRESSAVFKESNAPLKRPLKLRRKKLASKKAKLKKTANDMTTGVVKRGKAANQLEQLEAKDPLPLQRAKITQAAVVKKCEKATKKAAKATAKAVKAREVAEADEAKAKAAAQDAENAVSEAEKAIEAAQQFLEKVKEEVKGAGKGKLWMLDRELEEARKFMPKHKLKKLEKKVAAEKKA